MTDNSREFFRDNPWDLIDGPCYPEGRRLYLHDERFWVSIDEHQQFLFFIQDKGAENLRPLENLAGLDVKIELCSGDDYRLICRLTSKEPDLVEKFAIVAKDIAFHCSAYHGAQLFIKTQERIKSWANFLRPSRSGLTYSEFLGFLGELYVLAEHLMRGVSPASAVRAWVGPEGKKQDFTLNDVALEVKTTASGDPQSVMISSLDQLDRVTEKLYLLRVVVAPSNETTGFSLGALYTSCLDRLGNDVIAEGQFLQKASKLYGKASEHQISDKYFILGLSVFDVCNRFPKLTRSETDPAILEVNYKLSVPAIAQFEVNKSIEEIVING